MLLKLTAVSRGRRVDAEGAWDAVRNTVPFPFPYTTSLVTAGDEPFNCGGIAPVGLANAQIVPRVNALPEYGLICLPEEFFSLMQGQQLQGQQALVLLHELIHLRLYSGRLSTNYRIIQELQRARRPPAQTAFERERDNLATELLTVVQEIGADKYFSANYPRQLNDYLDMRVRFFYLANANAVSEPCLEIYRLTSQLLRVGLGLLIVQDPTIRQNLETRQRACDADLEREAQAELPWFRAVLQQLLRVTVDTDDSDPDAYRELYDRVSNLAN